MSDRTPEDTEREAKELKATGAGQLSFGLSAVGDDLGKTITEALSNADMITGVAARKAQAAASNDLIPHDGRARLAREAIAEGKDAVAKAADQAYAAHLSARKKAVVACMPAEPTDAAEVSLVRQAVQMELDGRGGDPLDAAFHVLQSDDREGAAVMAGAWGRRWLRSKGITLDADTVAALDASIVEGSRKHGTPEQQKAAARLAKGGELDKLKGGIDVALGAARHRLED